MSLNWDTTNCPHGPATEATDEERSWLDVLIWGTILFQQSSIDEDETLFRVRYLERLGYALASSQGQPVPVPRDAIVRWHGTTVNVAPRTRNQFVTHWAKAARADVESAVAREIRESVDREALDAKLAEVADHAKS